METNFNGSEITNEQELLDFALVVPFHGLILRPSKSENSTIIKGIKPRRFKKIHLLLEKFNNLMLKQICVPCTILAG
jgi:hypothetical protein